MPKKLLVVPVFHDQSSLCFSLIEKKQKLSNTYICNFAFFGAETPCASIK